MIFRVSTPYGNYDYTSLNEFIEHFPHAERQCVFQVQQELQNNGYFLFSDFDCPHHFKLYPLF